MSEKKRSYEEYLKENEQKRSYEEYVNEQAKDEAKLDQRHSSHNKEEDEDEYVSKVFSEIRKNVECPICLGIIRETRTVLECMHRFCKVCIEKSMRRNNECPSCRKHLPSRRSLSIDPNYDALIAAIYPNIDEVEKEELALLEEELALPTQGP